MNLLESIKPFVEISIIAVMVNYLLSFFWNTRSMDLMLGATAFFAIFILSSWFNFPIVHKILLLVSNVAMIAVLIIFQPELRVALSKLSWKGKRQKQLSDFDKLLDALAQSVFKLSERKIGALIALEHEDRLGEFAAKGVHLDALFSSELLETIFATTTPLHDGAIIIKEAKIVAAAVILPLAEDSSQLTKSMGTRHRAALGLSQLTDAVVIVISEESGKVSIARGGIITRSIKTDRFKGIIRSIFSEEPSSEYSPSNLFEWLKK